MKVNTLILSFAACLALGATPALSNDFENVRMLQEGVMGIGEEMYFDFKAEKGKTILVELTGGSSGGDLDMQVMADNGKIWRSESPTVSESIVFVAPMSGQYQVAVWNASQQDNINFQIAAYD